MTFREIITSADGSTEEGTCTEEHALSLLRTAVRRGYRTEATRAGGAVIVRDVHSGGFVPRHRTVTLEPATSAGTLTATVRGDLDAIARYPRAYLACDGTNAGRIIAGLIYGIPPATAARLMARGLVTVGEAVSEHGQERRPVAVSLAARLAMLAQDHRTSTRHVTAGPAIERQSESAAPATRPACAVVLAADAYRGQQLRRYRAMTTNQDRTEERGTTMTREQAREFRAKHDADARHLSGITKAALASIAANERLSRGVLVSGALRTKEEMVSEILGLRYPVERLNEAIHTLHHDVAWPDCPHCHASMS